MNKIHKYALGILLALSCQNAVSAESRWQKAGAFSDGLAMVTNGKFGKNALTGYIDKSGELVIPLSSDWDQADNFIDGLAKVRKGKLAGMIDKTGKVVIPIEWEELRTFHDGLAVVKKGYSYGYIDKTGKAIAPLEWEYAVDFSEGLARVFKGNKCGYIDTTGKLVIPNEWDKLDNDFMSGTVSGSFHNGLAVVSRGGKYGYIDKTGKLVVPATLDFARPFFDEFAASGTHERSSFLNTRGEIVQELKWGSSVGCYMHGVAMLDGSKARWINKKGEILIPYSCNVHQSLAPFPDSRLAITQVKEDGSLGIVDNNGKVVPLPDKGSDYVGDTYGLFSEGLVPVRRSEGVVFLDKDGKVIIESSKEYEIPKFTSYDGDKSGYGSFTEGLAKVKLPTGDGFIDKEGKVVIRP